MTAALATAFALLAIGLAFGTFRLGYMTGKSVRHHTEEAWVNTAMTRTLLRSGYCAHQHPSTGQRCMYRLDHNGPHAWACNLNAAAGPICRLPKEHLGDHQGDA